MTRLIVTTLLCRALWHTKVVLSIKLLWIWHNYTGQTCETMFEYICYTDW